MTRFHRFQPADDAAIDQFIQRSDSRPRLNRRLDWIVHDGPEAIGLASLVDLDHEQRRAELLVGFPRAEGRPAAALKASLAAMQFAFGALKLNRLISYVYGDNPASQANTLHLGLRQEGLLREHLRVDGVALDLHVNGLLAREYFADARLQRLLQRWGGEHSS
jgi:diamine N-acetyltransferase